MSPDQLEKVFDKYYRTDAANTALEGSGLGLTNERSEKLKMQPLFVENFKFFFGQMTVFLFIFFEPLSYGLIKYDTN